MTVTDEKVASSQPVLSSAGPAERQELESANSGKGSSTTVDNKMLHKERPGEQKLRRSNRKSYTKSNSSLSSDSDTGSSSSSSGGGEDDKEVIKKILKGVNADSHFKAIYKKFPTIEKCKEASHRDMRDVGLPLYTEREKIINAFAEYVPKKRSKSRSKSKSKSLRRSRSRSRSGSSSSSESGSEDEVAIKNALRSVHMEKYFEPIYKKHPTLKKCKKLDQRELKDVGVIMYSERDKIITAFETYKPKQGKSSKRSKSHKRRGSSSSSSRSSSSSTSRSSSSSASSVDEKKEIKKVLKSAGAEEYYKDLVKKHKTIKDCKSLTVSELRLIGVNTLTQRDRIVQAFAGYKSKRSKSKSKSRRRSRSRSGSSSSSSGSDDASEITRVLESVDQEKYAKALIKNHPTIKECKKLTHADLRPVGIAMYAHRDKVINAFRDYKPTERKGTRRSRKSCRSRTRGSSSSSSESSGSNSSRYSSSHSGEDDIIIDVLTNAGAKRHFRALKRAGFGTVEKCKTLKHSDLREVGVNEFAVRSKILNGFKEVSIGSSSSESAEQFRENDYVAYRGRSPHIRDGAKGVVVCVGRNNRYQVQFGVGNRSFYENVNGSDLEHSHEGPKKLGFFRKIFGYTKNLR